MKKIVNELGLVLVVWLIHELSALFLEVQINRDLALSIRYRDERWVLVSILMLLFYFLVKSGFKKGLSLMFAGGIVNLIDRFRFGGVRDYWNWGWFYNNINDVIIVGGLLWTTIQTLKKQIQK